VENESRFEIVILGRFSFLQPRNRSQGKTSFGLVLLKSETSIAGAELSNNTGLNCPMVDKCFVQLSIDWTIIGQLDRELSDHWILPKSEKFSLAS